MNSPSIKAFDIFCKASYWPLNVTEPPGWLWLFGGLGRQNRIFFLL